MERWIYKIRKSFQKFEKTIFILAAATLLTSILMNLEFNLLEANLFDFRVTGGVQPVADQRIVLITLDDQTTKTYDDFAPLGLDHHTRLLETLEQHDPKAIGYLVNLNHVSQVNPDLFRSDWAARFIRSAHRMRASGTPVLLGTPFDVNGEVLPPYPLSSLPHSIAVIHKDGNVFAEDKVTRRALTKLYKRPTFHIELAKQAKLIETNFVPRGSFYVPQVDGEYFFFRYHGTDHHYASRPQDQPSMPYPHYSFNDVIEGKVAREKLAGKIILVGTLIKESPSDFVRTPFSKKDFINPKLLVHANILDSVIQDDGIILLPKWVTGVITFIVTGFIFWWVLISTPLYGVFATIGSAILILLVSQILFQGIGRVNGLWFYESQPLLGIFLSYYLVVPYRLIREYKKRWEYQRKHDLLTQVEELKTNFLSLVTHDLKTPVARIQGLAEATIGNHPLSEDATKNIRQILNSTDDLNRFISTILELSKVESSQLKLNLESKDINTLIERSVDYISTQANREGIAIDLDLDPLFPIKIDTNLILKVLNNLLDNAIKYSPAGSTITVSTQEVDDRWVEISVQDQGIGLDQQEIDNLFSKFYRVKNETTAQVSGTGLGLYLTKYFVEAHRGRVWVDSIKGKGSTFCIQIPMDIDQESGVAPGLSFGALKGEKYVSRTRS